MQERQEIFNNYMNSFVKLNSIQKCKEVIEKQKRF